MHQQKYSKMAEKQSGLLAYYQKLPATAHVSPKSDFIAEVCKACDVSMSTARNWVFGRSKPADQSQIEWLSLFTGIPADKLWE